MRTGADYRQSLRDGRRVWVMGEGQVEDVTTHPATHAMVEEYAAWYDRHLDPAWQDLLLTPPNADRERIPLAYVMPKSAEDLTRMSRSFAKTTFLGRRQHYPHSGLRQFDRARRLDRTAGRIRRRMSRSPRRSHTVSRLLAADGFSPIAAVLRSSASVCVRIRASAWRSS